jgi:hypothetical protein
MLDNGKIVLLSRRSWVRVPPGAPFQSITCLLPAATQRRTFYRFSIAPPNARRAGPTAFDHPQPRWQFGRRETRRPGRRSGVQPRLHTFEPLSFQIVKATTLRTPRPLDADVWLIYIQICGRPIEGMDLARPCPREGVLTNASSNGVAHAKRDCSSASENTLRLTFGSPSTAGAMSAKFESRESC